MIKYNSIAEIKEAVKNGSLVNWQNALYYVKIDFEGDFLIKCTETPMQEILSDNHNVNDFFTVENTNTVEKFARKCNKSGKGINKGFCINDGNFYLSEESYLIEWLRGQNFQTAEGTEANSLSDDNLKEWAYNDEIYYWTEWEIEAGENWYNENGEEFEDNSLLLEEYEEGAQNRFRNNDNTSFEEWLENKKETLNE